jgi:hypothetical protein
VERVSIAASLREISAEISGTPTRFSRGGEEIGELRGEILEEAGGGEEMVPGSVGRGGEVGREFSFRGEVAGEVRGEIN